MLELIEYPQSPWSHCNNITLNVIHYINKASQAFAGHFQVIHLSIEASIHWAMAFYSSFKNFLFLNRSYLVCQNFSDSL